MWFVKLSAAAEPNALPSADTSKDQAGPFKAQELTRFLQDDVLDGLSLVRQGENDEWQEIAKVEAIKLLIAAEDDAQEEKEQTEIQAQEKSTKEGKTADTIKSRAAQIRALNKRQNCAVYVSGLPTADLDEDDLVNHMKRGGVIKVNPDTVRPSVKLYRDSQGNLNGDALVIYAKPESVVLAIKYLSESYLHDNQIKVEEAQPPKRAASKAIAADAEARKKKRVAAKLEEARQLSWAVETPSFSKTKNSSKVLIIRPCWTADQAWRYKESSYFWTYVKDVIAKQLARMGAVDAKVVPVKRHPLGIVCVKCKSSEKADNLLLLCQAENVDLSPLRVNPIYKDTPSEMYFYEGRTDFQAQALPEEVSSVFSRDTDLDAMDRLWLIAAGILPDEFKVEDQVEDDVDSKANVVISEDEGHRLRTLNEMTMRKVDELGDWLEAQSSDEEFKVTAESVPSDDEA